MIRNQLCLLPMLLSAAKHTPIDCLIECEEQIKCQKQSLFTCNVIIYSFIFVSIKFFLFSFFCLAFVDNLELTYPESIRVFIFGKFMSKLVNIESYECRSNKYRSIASCVIGTLNFFARKNRNKKLESGIG